MLTSLLGSGHILRPRGELRSTQGALRKEWQPCSSRRSRQVTQLDDGFRLLFHGLVECRELRVNLLQLGRMACEPVRMAGKRSSSFSDELFQCFFVFHFFLFKSFYSAAASSHPVPPATSQRFPPRLVSAA